jgi:hypothetical protein
MNISNYKRTGNTVNKPQDIRQMEDLFRGLVTLGLFDAYHVLTLFFKGDTPINENELSPFHQLDVPLRLSWQNFDEEVSGGFLHESGPHLLELNYKERKLADGADLGLLANISHAMIAQLMARTAILAPDRVSAYTVLDSYYGSEMNELLSIAETPKAHAARMKEASERRDFSRDHLSRVDFLGCLNSVLAARCPVPGRIPHNKTEGWAALAAEGFPMTPEVEKALRSTEQGKKATALFGQPAPEPSQNNFDPAVAELVVRVNKFKPEQLKLFWNEVVPAALGDLRTLYGDRNGRTAMGLPTPDAEGARAYAQYVTLNRGQWREDKLRELAAAVNTSYAWQLFQYVSRQGIGRQVSVLMENKSFFDAVARFAPPEKLNPFRPLQDVREMDRKPGQGFRVVPSVQPPPVGFKKKPIARHKR